MTVEKPYLGRAKIEEVGSLLSIDIPSKKNWFMIIFLTAWLAGWLFGEIFAIFILIPGKAGVGPEAWFMIFWLIGWTVGGGFAIFALLWNLFGKEIIIFESDKITIEKKILSFGSKKEYAAEHIKSLRMNAENNPWGSWNRAMQFWGFGDAKLAFDYGMKTIKFAGNIDEAEAGHILSLIRRT